MNKSFLKLVLLQKYKFYSVLSTISIGIACIFTKNSFEVFNDGFCAVSGTIIYTKMKVENLKKLRIAKAYTFPASVSKIVKKIEPTAKLLIQLVAVARAQPVPTRWIGNISD